MVAYEWQVKGLIEGFERADADSSFDVHRGKAARIFRKTYDDIPKDDRAADGEPTLRFLGKRCVHGLNYRMGPQKLAEVCGISLSQANEAYSSYHRAFPEIRAAWTHIIATYTTEKMLFNHYGRRLMQLGRITEDELESIVAFVPQSSIGDKVGRSIYLIHDDPEWPKTARTAINIHDAIITIHPISERLAVQRVMVRHAEEPIIIRGQPIVIGADVKESYPDENGVHRWSTIK